MQLSPNKFYQPGFALLIGLAGGLLPGISQASSGIDVNFSANIVDSTCKLSLADGGNVYLPTVTQSWFYNSDNSNRLSPTDSEAGTPFTIQVTDCHAASSESGDIQKLHFSFSPQNGFWSSQNQVFKNDATVNAAENVGVVIFSAKDNVNVLNSDGSSDVIFDVSKSESYLTDYAFYARYQNIGKVKSGMVNANVLVDVHYD